MRRFPVEGDDPIKVRAVLNSCHAISTADGERVCRRVRGALCSRGKVAVSFAQLDTLTPTFLNAAIGQLYATFSEDRIRSDLSVHGLTADRLELLRRVVKNAKAYFLRRETGK